MKSLTVILVVSFTSYVFGSDETFDSDAIELKMSADCIEGLGVCRDFMSHQNCLDRRSTWKRADASGPFWANRGRRGPKLITSRMYAELPHWKLVRRDEDGAFDPFFTTRGKKLQPVTARDRRTDEQLFFDGTSPFLAARGKRNRLNLAE